MPANATKHLFAILSWGGIGDTLRNLSLIPHAAFFEKTGWQTPVVYLPWEQLGCRADALPPDAKIIRELVGRCPSLRWGGIVAPSRMARTANRLLREMLVLTNHGVPPIFPCEVCLSRAEERELPERNQGVHRIGIQTHLLGLPCKKWPVSHWRRFLVRLRGKIPDAEIHLIEPGAAVAELCFDEKIFAHAHFTLPQSIRLVEQMDYVISIDSWVKCVAAWRRIPQTVIVPDRRADYPELTAKNFLRYEFATLQHLPEVTLLGLDAIEKVHTLPVMAEIDPDMLFEKVFSSLPPLGTGM